MKEYPPFYIGQKVICVSTNIHGNVVVGKEYVIIGIRRKMCKCGGFSVDVGMRKDYTFIVTCHRCKSYLSECYTMWFDSTRFAPIIEDMQAVTFEKITELEPVSVN